MADETPMMRQYYEIKSLNKDSILFFRLGDFYEMFEEDAQKASRILGLTLTKRGKTPMCGIPYHSSRNYIKRLLEANCKIAICEQVSPPGQGKIVERRVVEVLSPGTLTDQDFLTGQEENCILSLHRDDDWFSISILDLSTGDFSCQKSELKDELSLLRKTLLTRKISEILYSEDWEGKDPKQGNSWKENGNIYSQSIPIWNYELEKNTMILLEHFGTNSLKGFGLDHSDIRIISSGILLSYAKQNLGGQIPHVTHLRVEEPENLLFMDDSTFRNLEIFENIQGEGVKYSLLGVLGHTKSPGGSRLMREIMRSPLVNHEIINRRLDTVQLMRESPELLENIRKDLANIRDLTRLNTRLMMQKSHPRDLHTIGLTIREAKTLLDSLPNTYLKLQNVVLDGDQLSRISQDILEALREDAPVNLTDSGIFQRGFNQELDRLQDLTQASNSVLDEYLEDEKRISGIPNIRIKYNKIIGYFFEVSKGNLGLVPEHFQRKQTLVNGERFTTSRLRTIQQELLEAEEKYSILERELFLVFRIKLGSYSPLLKQIANFLSNLDVFQALSWVSLRFHYTRPILHEDERLTIEGARHPVVEQHLSPGVFVENDLVMDDYRFLLLTGPNMAGKSTYLRQAAQIIFLAQIGSFVPAKSAQIGLVDKIFCRVGASDNLARGESTFLVEMNETANILNNASRRSFVIMDEVGRGTTTNDGLSLAWAITEFLLEKVHCKTLFATHYHELTQIGHEKLKNASMAVHETGETITFLRRLLFEPAGRSYGIHVARLAGIPRDVLIRASEILSNLEGDTKNVSPAKKAFEDRTQNLFPVEEIIRSKILSLDINSMTPLDALKLLSEMQDELR